MSTKLQSLTSDLERNPNNYLIEKYWAINRAPFSAHLEKSFAIVENFSFNSKLLVDVHRKQTKYALLEKHSIPYVLALKDFANGDDSNFDCHILAGLLAVHTMALTQLDYHMDGIRPSASPSAATGVRVALHDATAYAVAVMHKGYAELATSPHGSRVISEVVAAVSGFTSERMYEDYRDRKYDFFQTLSRQTVAEYLDSPFSRVLASGYWELMVHSAAVCSSVDFDGDMSRFCNRLRVLRQVVDEWEDVEEDIRSGLVTLPLVLMNEIYVSCIEFRIGQGDLRSDLTARMRYASWAQHFLKRRELIDGYDSIVFKVADEALTIAHANNWLNLSVLVEAKLAKYLTSDRRHAYLHGVAL